MLWMTQWNPKLSTVVDEKLVNVDFEEMIRGKIIENVGKEKLVVDDFQDLEVSHKNEYEEYWVDTDINVEINGEIKGGNFTEIKPNLIGMHKIPKPTLSPEIQVIYSRLNLLNPGHMGSPVILPPNTPEDILKMFNQSWEIYQINEFGSKLVPLDRELPDMRTEYCKNKVYNSTMPMASCIMVFHNEALSMILRTVYSILIRSPPHLLREIVLIDDCSTHGELFVTTFDFSRDL